LLGCSKESALQLNTEDVVMYSLDEHYITSNGTNVSFSSENPYIASVNATTGKVTGMHIGETYINVVADQGSAKVKVTIKAKYHTITDPYLDWGASKSDVLDKVNMTPFSEDEYQMSFLYGDANYGHPHIGTSYLFRSGVALSSVMVLINNDFYTEAVLYLAERFQYIGEKQNTIVFVDAIEDKDINTLISFSKQSGQYVIIYSQYD
jgi:hypothetical protein